MASMYTTIQGDTWDMIAFKHYKNERQMTTLIEANAAHRETVVFSGGVVLHIPDLPLQSPVDLPPWRLGDGV